MNKLAIVVLQLYRLLLSPLLPPNTCRFHPSCSSYALEAFQKYSFTKATALAVKRIGRCHPWHAGGYDPVP